MKASKTFLTILSLVLQLYFVTTSQAEPAAVSDGAHVEPMFQSVSLPEKEHLSFVSFLQIFDQETLMGGVAAYDDPMTTRSADYLELYNSAGHLVAIGWFDNFGIERVAVDRAVLEDADDLEGVFVVLVDGDLV